MKRQPDVGSIQPDLELRAEIRTDPSVLVAHFPCQRLGEAPFDGGNALRRQLDHNETVRHTPLPGPAGTGDPAVLCWRQSAGRAFSRSSQRSTPNMRRGLTPSLRAAGLGGIQRKIWGDPEDHHSLDGLRASRHDDLDGLPF